MIGDPILQDNLVFLAEKPYSNRRAQARQEIYQQLYSYVYRSKYIKTINIILTDGTNICMGSSDEILKFDLRELDKTISDLKGQATWAPA